MPFLTERSGSLYLKTSEKELVSAALSSCRELRLFVEWDFNSPGLEELIPFCQNYKNTLVINLWKTGEYPADLGESLACVEEVTGFVRDSGLSPENVFLKPCDRAVNLDARISRLYLDTLKHLKNDCYPEYGTLCPVEWKISPGSREEEELVVFLSLLAGFGQDGVLVETTGAADENVVKSLSRLIASVNKYSSE